MYILAFEVVFKDDFAFVRGHHQRHESENGGRGEKALGGSMHRELVGLFAAAGKWLDHVRQADLPSLLGAISAQASGADIVIAEGSMGLYDGVAKPGATGHGTSAETAAKMGWGVILVIDVSGQAQSAAATALA